MDILPFDCEIISYTRTVPLLREREGTPSKMSYQAFDDPNDETQFGLQVDRETFEPGWEDQPPPWNVGDRLDEFELEKLLGSGKSGFVYRAFDSNENKRVALKLLRPGSTDSLLRNKLGFRKMMSIDHPNLVRVNRIHHLGSFVALSMEEVEGVTFRQTQRELLRLEPAEAYDQLLRSLHQFAAGLAEMHRHGLVHRDIKPANLMIRSDGVAKIIDYGLVDPFQLNEIRYDPRGDIFGTPRYIAPEVYWRQQYLPSGDIFGLGISLLETLLLIQGDREEVPTELVRSRKDQGIDGQRISDALDDLPDSVPMIIRQTCRQMLSRDPADRPTAIGLVRVGCTPSAPVNLSLHQAIVGRQSEIAQLQSWVDGIFNGSVGRLHLSGPSGTGKSLLVEKVIEYIESKKWGQLFHAKCRIGEDLPMQAFDQIVDAVASRYMRGDREPLELDPVSVTILNSGFPVLSSVLKSRMDIPLAGPRAEFIDVVEAAVRMSAQLRLVGPLFLVIDDSQWADEESRSLLDRLSHAKEAEGVGVLTVSREADSHRLPAQNSLDLGPLSRLP